MIVNQKWPQVKTIADLLSYTAFLYLLHKKEKM